MLLSIFKIKKVRFGIHQERSWHVSGTLPDIGWPSWLLRWRSSTPSGFNLMFPIILALQLFSRTENNGFGHVSGTLRNHWRMFLTPEMDINNPKWFQCDVLNHIFQQEKNWGWYLYSSLRYQHVYVDILGMDTLGQKDGQKEGVSFRHVE